MSTLYVRYACPVAMCGLLAFLPLGELGCNLTLLQDSGEDKVAAEKEADQDDDELKNDLLQALDDSLGQADDLEDEDLDEARGILEKADPILTRAKRENRKGLYRANHPPVRRHLVRRRRVIENEEEDGKKSKGAKSTKRDTNVEECDIVIPDPGDRLDNDEDGKDESNVFDKDDEVRNPNELSSEELRRIRNRSPRQAREDCEELQPEPLLKPEDKPDRDQDEAKEDKKDEAADAPTEETADVPTEEAADVPTEETAEETADAPTEETAEETADAPPEAEKAADTTKVSVHFAVEDGRRAG